VTAVGVDRDAETRALLRWRRGHQAFHLYLVAMNTLLDDLVASVERGDWAVETRLRRLADLYDAATASMKYAADFPSELYAGVVRPSMMPPAVRPGFSGTLNREHRGMTTRLRRLRTLLGPRGAGRRAPAPVLEAWSLVRAAHARNLTTHGLVCSRFVPDGTSLLQHFYRERDAAGGDDEEGRPG
jgi:hypothetical protein